VIVLNKNLRLKMIASKDKRKKRKSSDYQNSCNNIIEDLFLRMKQQYGACSVCEFDSTMSINQ